MVVRNAFISRDSNDCGEHSVMFDNLSFFELDHQSFLLPPNDYVGLARLDTKPVLNASADDSDNWIRIHGFASIRCNFRVIF